MRSSPFIARPQSNKAIARLNLGFAWFNAAVFIFAAVWGTLEGLGTIPLAGLRRISADLSIAWPLALFVSLVAVQLSVARLRTRAALFFTSGALACGWFVMVMYVAPGPAIGLAILAGSLYRQGASAEA